MRKNMEELEKTKQKEFLLCNLIPLIAIILIGISLFFYAFQQTMIQKNLLQQEIEGLREEKEWIWDNAVTMRIEYGEPSIEGDRIILPVIGLSRTNETLFMANASLPFKTENAVLQIHDGALIAYKSGDEFLKQRIRSLEADLEFYKQQYRYYQRKYLESQPKGLQALLSNQIASLPLWNATFEFTVQNLRYSVPFQNRSIPVKIEYYRLTKAYGCYVFEFRNFTNIQSASFPILSLEMVNGSYAYAEWKLISEDETKYVIRQTLRFENVTFNDGSNIQEAELTLIHETRETRKKTPQAGSNSTG